jgi:thymidylate synthase (FAD)
MVNVNLVEIDKFPNINYKNSSIKTIEDALSPMNISFSVEKATLAKTHEICEGKDSYTQQSMRYVKMGEGAFIVPPVFSDSLKKEFSNTMEILLNNYIKLSELKDEFKEAKGRPKSDWFKYAPIEDNRYGLSLATPSNIKVTMSGNKLINFFSCLSKDFESTQIFSELSPYIPKDLRDICYEQIGSKDFKFISQLHREKLDKALKENFIDIRERRFEQAGIGALTSTNENTPSEIIREYQSGGNCDEKLQKVAERVLGYNHISIIEHARHGLGLGMSLVTYHQFERHRIPTNIRDDFRSIPLEREVLIPPKIAENEKATEIFQSSISVAKKLREKLLDENEKYNHYALLNGTRIGVYSGMEARTFAHIANERLCNNAQWEFQRMMEDVTLMLREKEPKLYEKSAPKCVLQKKCPEGKLTCGKYAEVKQKYE